MTPADRIAELEAKLVAMSAECGRYYGHVAGLLWSGRIDNLTGDDMQKMADECKADKAKLARYESVTGLPEEPPRKTAHGWNLECPWWYADKLIVYAMAMKAENDELKRTDDVTMTAFGKLEKKFRAQVDRAVKAESETVSALCQLADAMLLTGRILAERDAAKDALATAQEMNTKVVPVAWAEIDSSGTIIGVSVERDDGPFKWIPLYAASPTPRERRVAQRRIWFRPPDRRAAPNAANRIGLEILWTEHKTGNESKLTLSAIQLQATAKHIRAVSEYRNLLGDADIMDSVALAAIELERKLKIAVAKNKGTLANNLCPDHRDKQIGKMCLACTIENSERENVELKQRLKLAENLRSRTRIEGEEVGAPHCKED